MARGGRRSPRWGGSPLSVRISLVDEDMRLASDTFLQRCISFVRLGDSDVPSARRQTADNVRPNQCGARRLQPGSCSRAEATPPRMHDEQTSNHSTGIDLSRNRMYVRGVGMHGKAGGFGSFGCSPRATSTSSRNSTGR